jgi:hypothetical protein
MDFILASQLVQRSAFSDFMKSQIGFQDSNLHWFHLTTLQIRKPSYDLQKSRSQCGRLHLKTRDGSSPSGHGNAVR